MASGSLVLYRKRSLAVIRHPEIFTIRLGRITAGFNAQALILNEMIVKLNRIIAAMENYAKRRERWQ